MSAHPPAVNYDACVHHLWNNEDRSVSVACPVCLTEYGRWQREWTKSTVDRLMRGDPLPLGRALDVQVGGKHYKDMKIQPIEYIFANKLDFMSGNVVKYISRHPSKGGAADVRKAIHYCELILEMVYGEKGGSDGG